MKIRILALAFMLMVLAPSAKAQENYAAAGSPEATDLPGDMPADQSDAPYDPDAENWKTLRHEDGHHDQGAQTGQQDNQNNQPAEDPGYGDDDWHRHQRSNNDPNAVYNDPTAGGPQTSQAGSAVGSGMHSPALGPKMGGAGEVARKMEQQQEEQ